MSHTNPEIESHLNELAKICCSILQGGDEHTKAKSDRLLKSLLMSGYARKNSNSLQSDIETRVKAECMDCAMHRGGALSSLSSQLATQFSNLIRWESRTPDDNSPPKAANISSATDA